MPIFSKPYWYHQGIRKYTAVFGSMFSHLTVARLNTQQQIVQTLEVPISYAPREKWLARLRMDPELIRPVEVQLPAISFELSGLSYAGDRRKAHHQSEVSVDVGTNSAQFRYSPLPWDFHFSLYLYVKNADDGHQLLEQILPFFGPEWTVQMNLAPSAPPMNIPVILKSVSQEDNYEGQYETRRALIWTLQFTMRGYLYGPTQTSGIIKRAQVDLHTALDNPSREARIVVTPGLTAAGLPTTNSAASISYRLISANSNFGIAVDMYEYSDGFVYNPHTLADE